MSTFEPGDGAAPGEYEVAITSAVPPPMPGTPPEMLTSPDPSVGVFVDVPARYQDRQASGLKALVEQNADNTFQFDLRSN